jgi:hypothetical protein
MIEKIPNAESMTAEEILSWLTAPRRERLPTADAMWSYAGIAERFGLPVAETIYQAIIAAGLTGLATRFASLGLDAGDPQWEQQVDALAAGVPELASLAGEISDLGYDTRPQWQVLGLASEPTLEAIQQEKTAAAAAVRKSTLLDRLADASQRCIAILDQWHRDIIDGKEATEPSTDELVAAFRAGLEG